MRLLYFILKILVNISGRVYYRQVGNRNEEPYNSKKGTLWVCNHPNSFMDPLVLGGLRKPIVHYLSRADIFEIGWLRPLLRSCHMAPIYRSLDGGDTRGANEDVFRKSYELLGNKKDLVIFSEGFTDDVFIRRVKPLKKGAARIAFGTAEMFGWDSVEIRCSGLNYTDPHRVASDLLISDSSSINVADYKAQYEENPMRAMVALHRAIEEKLHQQVVHVKKKDLAPFFEQLLILSRKGLNPDSYDKKLKVRKRWDYSKKLVDWFNTINWEEGKYKEFKEKSENYFSAIEEKNISDNKMFMYGKKKGGIPLFGNVLNQIIGFPYFLFGAINNIIPFLLTRKIVESWMKRPVFWGSVKMTLGSLVFFINYALIMYVLGHYVESSVVKWVCLALMPLSGIYSYQFMSDAKMIGRRRKFNRILKDNPDWVKEHSAQRSQLMAQFSEMESLAFGSKGLNEELVES